VEEDLGVGVVGLEAVAELFELGAEFAVVVDAPVEGDGDEVGALGEVGGVDGVGVCVGERARACAGASSGERVRLQEFARAVLRGGHGPWAGRRLRGR
jgi:hypothetical protein